MKKSLTLTSPKQKQGGEFEQLALIFLQNEQLILVAQNWLAPKVGELDLVMIEKGSAWDRLVFVEVRQRKSGVYGDAAMSVTKAKQRKIIKAAKYFLASHQQYAAYEYRFDVVTYVDKASAPEWITGAFVSEAWT